VRNSPVVAPGAGPWLGCGIACWRTGHLLVRWGEGMGRAASGGFHQEHMCPVAYYYIMQCGVGWLVLLQDTC
jgi:hypothetical protein